MELREKLRKTLARIHKKSFQGKTEVPGNRTAGNQRAEAGKGFAITGIPEYTAVKGKCA